MPTLNQPDTSIYGKTQLFTTLSGAGQLQPAGRQAAGPNASVMRLQSEQALDQQVQQLAQQYGDDYDGLAKAVGQLDPERGQKLSALIAESRTKGVQQDLENSKLSQAHMDLGIGMLQKSIDDPSVYPTVAKMVAAASPQLTPFLPDPSDPQLNDKLLSLVDKAQSTKDYLAHREKSAQLYLDGKPRDGALTLLAGSATPQQWQASADIVKRGGLGDLLNVVPDQASAQAMLEKQQSLKPTDEKVQGLEQEALKAQARTLGKTVDQLTPQEVEAVHRQYKQAGTIVRVAQASAAGPSGELSPEGVDYAATQYRLTGKMPALGMGKTPARAQIINKAAEQTRLIGQTPVASIQRQAVFAGDTKALAQLQKMQGAADAYENKAVAQLDIVDGLSDKVGRTTFPILNRAIMAGKTEIAGDPDATLLLNAIQTASAEYAKIMMGGTASAQALTDSAMKESQKLLNASFNPSTLRKATALMRTEMGLTMQGYDAAIGHVNERMGGQTSQGGPQSGIGPNDVQAPNGKTYHFATKAQADAFKAKAGIQ